MTFCTRGVELQALRSGVLQVSQTGRHSSVCTDDGSCVYNPGDVDRHHGAQGCETLNSLHTVII